MFLKISIIKSIFFLNKYWVSYFIDVDIFVSSYKKIGIKENLYSLENSLNDAIDEIVIKEVQSWYSIHLVLNMNVSLINIWTKNITRIEKVVLKSKCQTINSWKNCLKFKSKSKKYKICTIESRFVFGFKLGF